MKEMDEKNADDSHQKRVEIQKWNQEMVRQKNQERQLKKKSDNRSNARANQEVLNFWADDRLAAVGETSCLGGHRVRTDHWRGMNASQAKAIALENARVLAEGKARREQEAQEKKEYQMQLLAQNRAQARAEYAAQMEVKNAARRQLAVQLQQQRETMDRKAREKREQSKIAVSPEFFAAFGTSAR